MDRHFLILVRKIGGLSPRENYQMAMIKPTGKISFKKCDNNMEIKFRTNAEKITIIKEIKTPKPELFNNTMLNKKTSTTRGSLGGFKKLWVGLGPHQLQ